MSVVVMVRNRSEAEAFSQQLIKEVEAGKCKKYTEHNVDARTIDQNRLQRLWMGEAEAQGDHTREEYRGLCKLHFGVPILCEDELFRDKYERIIRPMPYEQQLELMMIPMDFPITRLMSKEQKSRYLDKIYTHFTGRGMKLTEPSLRGVEQYPEAS